jgi:hypothetical protein
MKLTPAQVKWLARADALGNIKSFAVQFDSVKHDIKDPTVLPTDMFEHVTPGLRERLQRMRL